MISPTQISSELGLITYNICWSRRATGKFEEYSLPSRKESVYQILKTNLTSTQRTADILFLQEVHQDIVEEVKTTLSEYKWVFAGTNARDGVCRNGIGVKASLISSEDEFIPFEYDFRHIHPDAEKVLGLKISNICLLNVHFPMQRIPRMAMAEKFTECLPTDKKYYIVSGDYNSMPDLCGKEQMETLLKVTNMVCISDLAVNESDGKLATRSFIAYPYDHVPQSAIDLPGKLDQILVSGFELAKGTTPIVMDVAKVPNKNFAPSDHYPMSAVLNLSKGT